jgi:hypothetical protein
MDDPVAAANPGSSVFDVGVVAGLTDVACAELPADAEEFPR